MPLYRAENVYRGINAHLHSNFQHGGDWADFHGSHIIDLRRALQAVLPVSSGYGVVAERSLQLAYSDDTSEWFRSRSRPDVTVYLREPETSLPIVAEMATPTLVFSARLVDFEEEDEVMALVITQIGTTRVVARIELLSPANKPPGSHAEQYRNKRQDTLASGIHLVEIDYLHERRSPLLPIPDYPRRASGAFPYSISISNAKTNLTEVYGLRVDDPLPSLPIPLLNKDVVLLDFASAYKTTYNGNNLYAQALVDYEKHPLNFESYDAEDQARIEAVMARAAEMR
ncbi:MAG: DUF4058 family protein [Anaerolineae bacterium]